MFLKGKKYYFNWKLIRSNMGLVTKKHIRLNDHKLKLFLRIIIMKNNINSKSVILDDIAISVLVSVAVVIPENSWRTIDWSIVAGLLTGQ